MPISADLHDRHYQPDDPGAAFAVASAALFAAFADVAFDPAMAHSPGSVSPDDVGALGQPVGELPPDLVGRFVIRAGTTWGSADDLRRITPRALTLAADNALPVDRAVLWEKLRWAGWPGWPAPQIAAVQDFLAAEWARLVRSPARPAHIAHRWLGAIAPATQDLEPFLHEWHEALGPLTPPAHLHAAASHLVALLVDSPLRPDLPATMADVIPPSGGPAAEQLTTWLIGPGTSHQLRRAAADLADTRDARRLALALERLRRFTDAVAQHASAD